MMDFGNMVRQLIMMQAQPVADKFDPLKERMNPLAATEGARGYSGGGGRTIQQVDAMARRALKQPGASYDLLMQIAKNRGDTATMEALQRLQASGFKPGISAKTQARIDAKRAQEFEREQKMLSEDIGHTPNPAPLGGAWWQATRKR